MSEINTPPKDVKKLTPVFAVLYILLSCLSVFIPVSGLSFDSLIAAFLTGPVLSMAAMLMLYGCLMSLGENGRTGALLVIIPTLFAPLTGYLCRNYAGCLYALLDMLSSAFVSAIVYYSCKKSENRSFACALGAFVISALSIFATAVSCLLSAIQEQVSFGTMLFDRIAEIIDVYIQAYTDSLNAVASLYSLTDVSSAIAANAEYLKGALTLLFALTPAILYVIGFMTVYIFSYIADHACKAFGITENYCFGKYEVSKTANTIFNILCFALIFSIFFDGSFSAFSCGILAVFLVLLPNYVILGIRRIYGMLKRKLSGGICVLIILAVGMFGIFLSPTLLIFILIFFGTAEYRSSKAGNISG